MDGKKILKRVPKGLLFAAAGFLPLILTEFLGLDIDMLIVIASFMLGFSGGLLYILSGIGAAIILCSFILCLFVFQDQGLGALVYFGVILCGGALFGWIHRKKMIKAIQKEDPSLDQEEAAKALDTIETVLSDTRGLMMEYEAECLSKGTCHLCRRGQYFQLLMEEDTIYFCFSGYTAEGPFVLDDENLTGEQRLLQDSKSFELKRSQIQAVTIRETIPRHPNGRKQLKLTFSTEAKEQVFFDTGLLEPMELERLLRGQFHLQVEGCDYTPVPASYKRQIEKARKQNQKAPMSLLGTLSFLTSMWLLFYPRPLSLVLGVNLLMAVLLFAWDWKKGTTSSDAYCTLGGVFALFDFIFASAAHKAGILFDPMLLSYFLPIPFMWLAMAGIVLLVRRKKQDSWKTHGLQALFCFFYVCAVLIWLMTMLQ